MDDIKTLAENILLEAAKDCGGNCYPASITGSKEEIKKALSLIAIYGHKTQRLDNSPSPIFTINENGRRFVANGMWSGAETKEALDERRHQEQLQVQRENNKLVKLNIKTTVIVGVLSALFSFILNRFCK